MAFSCLSCGKPLQLDYQACPGCGDAISDFLRDYYDRPLGGDYRLTKKIGRGGMGEVYKAQHIHLDNDVVIKVMRPNLEGDVSLTERFLREARVAVWIQHRNVANLRQFSALPDGSFYMVWEYIDGEDLGKIIRRRGALPPSEVIEISIQALEGLEAIHRAGFVHRDISPDNIMITREGRGSPLVKIIDLGIAKHGIETGETMTGTGMFVGKPKYASPEQFRLPPEERLDGRADLYSFAIVMYEMLAATTPFVASTPHGYMIKQLTEPPPPLPPERIRDGLALKLQSAILKALEKDRKDRYETAEMFAEALARILAHTDAAGNKETKKHDLEGNASTIRDTPQPSPGVTAPPLVAAAPHARETFTHPLASPVAATESSARIPSTFDRVESRSVGPRIAAGALLVLVFLGWWASGTQQRPETNAPGLSGQIVEEQARVTEAVPAEGRGADLTLNRTSVEVREDLPLIGLDVQSLPERTPNSAGEGITTKSYESAEQKRGALPSVVGNSREVPPPSTSSELSVKPAPTSVRVAEKPAAKTVGVVTKVDLDFGFVVIAPSPGQSLSIGDNFYLRGSNGSLLKFTVKRVSGRNVSAMPSEKDSIRFVRSGEDAVSAEP